MSASLFEHVVFLAILEPLLRHAQFAFRHIRNEHDREDFIQEVLCIAWNWTLRMLENNKDPREFPTAVAEFASKHVKAGRRFVGGKLGLKDVLSRFAQARHSFTAQSLPSSTATTHESRFGTVDGQRTQDLFEEILQEHDRSPVPEQAAFRIDFPAFLATLSDRNRRIAEDMMLGETTLELSSRHRVTPGRVSQLRREFHAEWHAFTDELV